MNTLTIFILFVAICTECVLLAIAIVAWRKAKQATPELRFQFGITHFWAAILGFTPSFLMVAKGLKDHPDEPGIISILAIYIPYQVFAIYMVLLKHDSSGEVTASRPRSFFLVLWGAFLGFVLTLVPGFLIAFFAPVVTKYFP